MIKKIVFLLHLPPPVHGSSMVGQFIKESNLINTRFETKYIDLGTSKTIDEIGKNPFGKILRYLSIVFQSFKHFLVYKPDLIYLAITAKGFGFYKDVVIVFLVKCFRIPLVLHFHNKGVHTKQDKKFDDFLYRKVFKNTKVILLSKYLYYDIKKYVNESDVYYCANGIPGIDKDIVSKSIKNEIPKLLFLSNLIESKGVIVLLKALKILATKGVDFTCNFVGGEGDISKDVFTERVKELQLEKQVFYLGKKYNSDKTIIFNNSDIFVLPSYNDCFPLVLLEASQFGLPMVATLEGAIPEIIENGINGFLVTQKNVEDLAEKLEVLISNSALRNSMGMAAKQKYEQSYTLKQFENNLLNILNSIDKKKKI
ncbi:glycosyltransferase family 4 protein [Polaribacter sp. L3A8]|uniref:glycosyltransferase family 4 protein n=1 Tax=Polaribacter sp. L3A8 TaxID=2686361 RepID=UPI001E283AE0|nr:glycosyltransferase family 4 protein [Polaribacter sp. L3A8]